MEKFKDRWVRREGFGEWYDGGELIHLLNLLSIEQPRTWTSLWNSWSNKTRWSLRRKCVIPINMWLQITLWIWLKEPSPIFLTFLKNFWRFWYHEKAHIFLITHGKFYSWKVFSLEDISENQPGYGNHNKAYSITYRQLQYTKLLHKSKWLDRFNWNFKFTSLEWWSLKWNGELNFAMIDFPPLNCNDVLSLKFIIF